MQLYDVNHLDFKALRDEMLMQRGGLMSPGHCHYYQAYYEHEFEECSFALVHGNSRLLLLVTRHWVDDIPCYSWFGRPVQMIDLLTPSDRAQSEGLARQLVLNLLTEKAKWDYCCMGDRLDWLAQLLLSRGGRPQALIEQQILLQQNDVLLASMRKVYRQNLKWGEKNLTCRIVDANNVTFDDIQVFESFHIRVAGRRTRSAESWLAQLELVRTGENFLVFTDYAGQLAGISLFAATGSQAYYSVGVYDRELFASPISHYPVWLGMQHARTLGCQTMEMGESYYADIPDSTGRLPSEKECKISHFKRGFGGELLMGFRFIL